MPRIAGSRPSRFVSRTLSATLGSGTHCNVRENRHGQVGDRVAVPDRLVDRSDGADIRDDETTQAPIVHARLAVECRSPLLELAVRPSASVDSVAVTQEFENERYAAVAGSASDADSARHDCRRREIAAALGREIAATRRQQRGQARSCALRVYTRCRHAAGAWGPIGRTKRNRQIRSGLAAIGSAVSPATCEAATRRRAQSASRGSPRDRPLAVWRGRVRPYRDLARDGPCGRSGCARGVGRACDGSAGRAGASERAHSVGQRAACDGRSACAGAHEHGERTVGPFDRAESIGRGAGAELARAASAVRARAGTCRVRSDQRAGHGGAAAAIGHGHADDALGRTDGTIDAAAAAGSGRGQLSPAQRSVRSPDRREERGTQADRAQRRAVVSGRGQGAIPAAAGCVDVLCELD